MAHDRPGAPRPRLPARVYWVRRAIVLGVLLVVVALLVVLGTWVVGLTRGGDADPGAAGLSPSGSPAPSTGAEGAADPGESTAPSVPAGPQACAPETLAVTLAADAATYGSGALPSFTVTIANNGADACLVDAGDAQREVKIASGTDPIWSSRDCAAAGTQVRQLLLAPGASDVTTVQWERKRSAAGCPGGQPAARAGTYSAALTVGTVASAPVVFALD